MTLVSEPAEILELFGKRAKIIKPGLDRTLRAWQLLGAPGKELKFVLVAGTNGKGSTSGLLWHLLAAAGFRVGHFSSPHLIEFRERINLSNRSVENDELVAHIQSIKASLPHDLWEELTFFEINTLLALLVFDQEQVDYGVLEVGLGGRLDSTNIVSPLLSVITNIGMDHSEYLGPNTAAIAKEKAGIMRQGGTCIWGGPQSSDLESDEVIQTIAVALSSPLRVLGRDFGVESTNKFHVAGKSWHLPKYIQRAPSFLKNNFTMAAAAFLELMTSQNYPFEPSDIIEKALTRFGHTEVPWPVTLKGRFHHIEIRKGSTQLRLLVDVCHNPHGAAAFARGLEETGFATKHTPKPAFISILSDKDASGIWNALKGRISDVIRFRINSERSWLGTSQEVPGPMASNFEEAFGWALQNQAWLSREQQPWLICGSVAAVGEVFTFLNRDGWTQN